MKRREEKMRKKLILGALLTIAIVTVSLTTSVQACNTPKDRVKYLPFIAYTSGTIQGVPPPPLFHIKGLGTGIVNRMGQVSLVADEFETFDNPPPQATTVSFTGTATLTNKCGESLTIAYQGSGKIGESFHGTYQINGGTGRFKDATGYGLIWGKAEVNPSTQTGTFTQWFVGNISF
jgi:hypothetical protein